MKTATPQVSFWINSDSFPISTKAFSQRKHKQHCSWLSIRLRMERNLSLCHKDLYHIISKRWQIHWEPLALCTELSGFIEYVFFSEDRFIPVLGKKCRGFVAPNIMLRSRKTPIWIYLSSYNFTGAKSSEGGGQRLGEGTIAYKYYYLQKLKLIVKVLG